MDNQEKIIPLYFYFKNKLGYNDNTKAINFAVTNYNNWVFKNCIVTEEKIKKLIVTIIFSYQITINTNTINNNTSYNVLKDILNEIFDVLKSQNSKITKEYIFEKYPQIENYYYGRYYKPTK